MPQTKEQIHSRHSNEETYVSPNFGDGGWHTTPGMQQFTTEWQPLFDGLLVCLLPQEYKGRLALPRNFKPDDVTRAAIVLKLGTGKRDPDDLFRRLPFTVEVGDEVLIGQFHDWQARDAGWGEDVVLCKEPDVRAIVRRASCEKN
jgi:co-chaperonin GroES (HSP10)